MTLDISNIVSNLSKLQENPNLKQLLSQLSGLGPSLVFGGAVRDWIVGKTPRDIDIVIDCSTKSLSLLDRYKGVKNKFGGYKLQVDGIEFDIWSLENTWALKNDAKFEKKLATIPFTAFLNLDAIAYRLDSQEIYENGFQRAMTSKLLDIMYEPNPYPYLCVSKALCALSKYELSASDNLKRYVEEQKSRGYNKKSFEKYNEMAGINFNYEECLKRIS